MDTKANASSNLATVSLIVVIAVGVLGNPCFRQRIYSGNSVPEIRKAFVTSAEYLATSERGLASGAHLASSSGELDAGQTDEYQLSEADWFAFAKVSNTFIIFNNSAMLERRIILGPSLGALSGS